MSHYASQVTKKKLKEFGNGARQIVDFCWNSYLLDNVVEQTRSKVSFWNTDDHNLVYRLYGRRHVPQYHLKKFQLTESCIIFKSLVYTISYGNHNDPGS